MRRVAVLVGLALAVGAGSAAAFGQSGAPAQGAGQEAPATWKMEITAGADGWVAPTEPLPVRVTLRSDLLLVGRIDAVVGGLTSSQAIEVPAGGVKDYVIRAGIPGMRRQLQVKLISAAGDEETVLQEERVSLRVPADDLVVATIGAEPHESAIRSATPQPRDQDVQLVRLGVADATQLNSAISYLVVPTSAMAEIDAAGIEAIRSWVEEGGRLIGSAANVTRVGDPAGGEAFGSIGAVGMQLGSGEVTAVTDFAELDAAAWSDLLRSVPQPGIIRVADDGGFTSLIGGALSSRSASVPALPWLLLGILLFVVLVGPVNFIVLRGFGKPEWAWATVPALSAVFVAGFWMVGRAQLQPFTVTHASVVVESGRGVEGRTAFVLQVESGGEHVLAMGDGWSSEGQDYPGVTPGVAGVEPDGRTVVRYELDDLGVGTAQGAWRREEFSDLEFSLVETESGFDVVVANDSDLSFDMWGVVVDGLGWIAADELPARGEAKVAARANSNRGGRYEPVILEAVQRRGFSGDRFYEQEFQVVYPMASFAERMAPALTENGVHFFGFTSDSLHDVAVDGRSAAAGGRTLLVVEVPDDGSILAARTSVRPRLLGVDGASSVEQYYEEIIAYGAEALYFHYTVPAAVEKGRISPGFTRLEVSEYFDWSQGEFVGFDWGDTLDLASAASPTGELVIRAATDEEERFFEEQMTLARFSFDWSDR